jgi:DNA-directed RNA polymerase specialized sigma24 family protein
VNSYTVTVTREEPFWVAEVEGLPGGATESRALSTLETEVRDLIAGLTDSDEESFGLVWDYGQAFPDQVATTIDSLHHVREKLAQVKEEYERLQREAVSGVRNEGVSVRDAAVLLHISYQRVSQLAS